jgi:excisionase family DNA binding protein
MTQETESPIRLTRQEAATALRMSLGTLDKRILEGSIASIRDGKRVFILRDELTRYLRGE